MVPKYKPHIPESLGDLMDKLTVLLLCSPKFVDTTGHFPGRSIETTFFAFNEGLLRLRNKLGESLFQRLTDLSRQTRACFEADPESKTGETRRGKNLVYEMEELIFARFPELRRSASEPEDEGDDVFDWELGQFRPK